MSDNNKNLFSELGKRGVYQAIGIYVAVSWGTIEILITASDRFGWPVWLGDAALILFLTAFPFVVLLAWAFDLTGSGLKRMEPGSLSGKVFIAGSLTVILGLSASWFVLRDAPVHRLQAERSGERPVIAVMPFQDQSGADGGDLLALAFTDEVINRVNVHPDIVALDLQSVTNPLMAGLLQGAGEGDLPFEYMVKGSLRPDDHGIELRVRLTNVDGLVVWDYDTVLDPEDAAGLREAHKFVAGQVAAGLGRSLTGIDYCQPSDNQKAVELFYSAKDRFAQRGAENVATAARMMEEAIQLDATYSRAMDLLSSIYMRFEWHVQPEPWAYGMSESEMIEFIEGQPEIPLARKALALCPLLASSFATVQLSVPVPQTFADAADIYEEALNRQPGNLELRSRLVDMFMKMGHIQAAGEVIREMHRRDPLDPRNTHALAWFARMNGDFQLALELESHSLEMGYARRNARAAMAGDLLTLDNAAGLDKLLGTERQSSDSTEIDPRRILAARSEPVQMSQLVAEYDALIAGADIDSLRRIIGNTFSYMFELGNEKLARRAMDRFSPLAGEGGMPWIVWHARYRHAWSDRILVYENWAVQWRDFWNRRGPPDGCTWEHSRLECEWAEAPSS